MGINDGKTGTIRAIPAPETAAARLTEFAEPNAAKGAKAFADGNGAYHALKNHERASRGDGEYGMGEVHVDGTESFWALARRGYNGTLRHIEPKRPRRYASEFAGRPSIKTLDFTGKMRAIARNSAGKGPTHRRPVAPSAPRGRPRRPGARPTGKAPARTDGRRMLRPVQPPVWRPVHALSRRRGAANAPTAGRVFTVSLAAARAPCRHPGSRTRDRRDPPADCRGPDGINPRKRVRVPARDTVWAPERARIPTGVEVLSAPGRHVRGQYSELVHSLRAARPAAGLPARRYGTRPPSAGLSAPSAL